ncbi:MAG: hypothetical protein KJZ59_05940, partial [Pararhodobacter sp.]|nr:hypothetical protein [Pararhodobacter sp.]
RQTGASGLLLRACPLLAGRPDTGDRRASFFDVLVDRSVVLCLVYKKTNPNQPSNRKDPR